MKTLQRMTWMFLLVLALAAAPGACGGSSDDDDTTGDDDAACTTDGSVNDDLLNAATDGELVQKTPAVPHTGLANLP